MSGGQVRGPAGASGIAKAVTLRKVTTPRGIFAVGEAIRWSYSEYSNPRSILALFRFRGEDWAVVAPLSFDNPPMVTKVGYLRKVEA